MLYERLNTEMKKAVDSYANRLKIVDWGRRSEMLTGAALPFWEDFPPEKAQIAARGFVTAVLERLGEASVTDARQALLYLSSLNPHHRAEAELYLEEHPEVRAAVDAGMEE